MNNLKRNRNFWLSFLFCIWPFTSCKPVDIPKKSETNKIQPATTIHAVPLTATGTSSPTVFVQTATQHSLPTEAQNLIIASPLAGIPKDELLLSISNLYSPPPQGSDDPHQGVDFSILDSNTGFAIAGTPVQNILKGAVAGIIENQFPYGNAVLIETPLASLPNPLLTQLTLPTPVPIQFVHPILTCPSIDLSGYKGERNQNKHQNRSLYLLYAHLHEPVSYELGMTISPSQKLGSVGDSGNAINPHLHLELRVGPAGISIPGMGHYDTSASSEDMANYCLWRVSGVFQLMDPLEIFFDSTE